MRAPRKRGYADRQGSCAMQHPSVWDSRGGEGASNERCASDLSKPNVTGACGGNRGG